MTSVSSDPSLSESQLGAHRFKGRLWMGLRIALFAGALLFLFQDRNHSATLVLLVSLLMGFYTAFRISHGDLERPQALFWLGLAEKLLANLIFLILFLRLLWNPLAPFPVVLCTGLVILTARNVFYLIFSVVLLKEGRPFLRSSFWAKATTLSLNVTMLLYAWDAPPYSKIFMAISILFMVMTSAGYLYFYYRNEESRKPLSVASQLTVSRVILAPFFIWVFFYDNDLIYQNNHIVFKVLALVLVILFVVSDGLDGYLARRMGQVTNLGKYLDPFSDKVSNMSIFLCFLASDFATVWMVALIYFREASIETLRTLAASHGIIVDARTSGKWKTALQGTAIITILTLAIADHFILQYWPNLSLWHDIWNYTPYTLMGAVAFITVLSGVDYIIANRHVLKEYV